MTEPTDVAIDTLILELGVMDQAWPTQRQLHAFARAALALAKWGTPAPVGVEPVAWLSPWRADQVTTDYDAYGEHGIPLYTTPQPTHAQAVNQADRPFIVRLAEDFAEECVTAGYVTTKAASYGRLMDEALSTQAQAGALTQAQVVEAFCKQPHPVQFVTAFDQGVRFAEKHHGIKGGQHGAE